MKSKVLVSSILTIALCLSLIAGSTFALFTDQTKFGIEVTSGDVEIYAKADIAAVYSAEGADAFVDEYLVDEYGHNYDHSYTHADTFLNGGNAVVTDGNLTLNRVTPGDRVDVTIKVDNKSDVAMVYRYKIIAEDVNLAYGMVVSVGDNTADPTVAPVLTPYEGLATWTSKWYPVIPAVDGTPSPIPDYTFTVELPVYAGNEYQSEHAGNQYYDENGDEQFYAEDVLQKVNYTVLVEAVQGNAVTDDESVVTLFPEAVARRVAKGGEFDGNGAVLESEGKFYVRNDISMKNVNINAANLSEYELLMAYGGYDAATNKYAPISITLDDGAVLNVANDNSAVYGVHYYFNADHKLTLKSGSKINASGSNAIAVLVQETDQMTIVLEDSGLINVEDGALGIVFENVGTADIYVPSVEAYEEYKAMTVSGAKQINWYIDGAPVATDANSLADALANPNASTVYISEELAASNITIDDDISNKTIDALGNDVTLKFTGKLDNVTVANIADSSSANGYAIDVSGATGNVTVKDSDFECGGTTNSAINLASGVDVTMEGCSFTGTGKSYGVWDTAAGDVKFFGCDFNNIGSWAMLLNGSQYGDLVVDNCTFTDCVDGLFKSGVKGQAGTTGTLGGDFVFTNNTLINCSLKTHNWFGVNYEGTLTFENNIKDGAAWDVVDFAAIGIVDTQP